MQERGKFLLVEGKLENGNKGCRKQAERWAMALQSLDFFMLQLTPFHKMLV